MHHDRVGRPLSNISTRDNPLDFCKIEGGPVPKRTRLLWVAWATGRPRVGPWFSTVVICALDKNSQIPHRTTVVENQGSARGGPPRRLGQQNLNEPIHSLSYQSPHHCRTSPPPKFSEIWIVVSGRLLSSFLPFFLSLGWKPWLSYWRTLVIPGSFVRDHLFFVEWQWQQQSRVHKEQSEEVRRDDLTSATKTWVSHKATQAASASGALYPTR